MFDNIKYIAQDMGAEFDVVCTTVYRSECGQIIIIDWIEDGTVDVV